jgi:hypothetical protein
MASYPTRQYSNLSLLYKRLPWLVRRNVAVFEVHNVYFKHFMWRTFNEQQKQFIMTKPLWSYMQYDNLCCDKFIYNNWTRKPNRYANSPDRLITPWIQMDGVVMYTVYQALGVYHIIWLWIAGIRHENFHKSYLGIWNKEQNNVTFIVIENVSFSKRITFNDKY